MRRVISLGMVAAAALGCGGLRSRGPEQAAAPPIEPPPAVSAAPSAPPNGPSGTDIVRDDCLTCHTEDLLRQQRLTDAQWAKTIDKMRRWGTPTEPRNIEALTGYLASSHGPDSGPFTPESIPARQAAALFEPRPDGVFAGGDRERGLALYRDRCLSCHEEDGRGGESGVNLVARQILDRAADFAAVIRTGRGVMPEYSETTDEEVADLLSYLRSMR